MSGPPQEWRPEVNSEDFLTESDLIQSLIGLEIEGFPALNERAARFIASAMWHPTRRYAQYRYTLGFRHGCDHQKREMEDAAPAGGAA